MFWFFAKFAFCSSRSTRSCLQAVMDSFLSRMFWMFSWTSRLNQKPLFLEFSGFYILFSFQGSLLSSHRQLIYIIISNWLCQQLFYFIFNLSQKPVCVSALIFSIDLPLSQGRMLWYQSFQGLSTIFLYLLFFLFCCDFLEYSYHSKSMHLFPLIPEMASNQKNPMPFPSIHKYSFQSPSTLSFISITYSYTTFSTNDTQSI